jgi:hypothetical protein
MKRFSKPQNRTQFAVRTSPALSNYQLEIKEHPLQAFYSVHRLDFYFDGFYFSKSSLTWSTFVPKVETVRIAYHGKLPELQSADKK